MKKDPHSVGHILMKQVVIHNPLYLEGSSFAHAFRGLLDIRQDQEIHLVDTQGQDLMFSTVVDIWQGMLAHVPAMLLELSSDPLQRTFTGLHTHLMLHRETDGQGTPLDTEITILVMKPKKSSIVRATSRDIRRHG